MKRYRILVVHVIVYENCTYTDQ